MTETLVNDFLINNYNLESSLLDISKYEDYGKVFSWKRLHKELFNALEIEKNNVSYTIFNNFVAAFNLISSIVMIVKIKKGIGILRSWE